MATSFAVFPGLKSGAHIKPVEISEGENPAQTMAICDEEFALTCPVDAFKDSCYRGACGQKLGGSRDDKNVIDAGVVPKLAVDPGYDTAVNCAQKDAVFHDGNEA